MIGARVASALPRMQAEAESLMVERCVVRRSEGRVTDPETGASVPAYGAPVYRGRCKVARAGDRSAQGRDVSDAVDVTLLVNRVDLPVAAGPEDEGDPRAVRIDDVIFVGAREFRVTADHDVTWQTAIRLPVERLS